eukprot:7884741-Alexandrium_andersonii.AAC.1
MCIRDSPPPPPHALRKAPPLEFQKWLDKGLIRAYRGLLGLIAADGTPVSYTHLRAHETSAHL